MRRSLVLVLSALALASGLGGAVAAQTGQGAEPMDPKAMEALMMKLATPGKPHQQLMEMAGKWAVTTTMYLEGPPQTSEGTAEFESVLGGRYVIGRYQGVSMGMPFEGMSIDGYDNGKDEFFSIWLDNFGTGYYIAHGTASPDGKTLNHSGTMVMGPLEIPSRSETVIVDRDNVTFTMWHTMSGQEAKAMEMVYKRVQ